MCTYYNRPINKEMKKFLVCGALAALALVSCKTNSSNTAAEVSVEPKSKVLVVVDVQRDFFDPSGSLYVSGSEELPAKIAAIAADYDAVVFTLDWHPADHCSFAAQGGIWPSHCVAYTQGAGIADEFSAVLTRGASDVQIFLKGTEQDKEQYGAFEDLSGYPVIKAWFENAESIDVCGIAGDYCVKESTNNILNFAAAEKVSVITDCVRSIDDGSTLEAFIAEKGLSRK